MDDTEEVQIEGGDTSKRGVQYACHEARATLDQQIEKIHREDEKAVKMARVNLIILGILVSSLSVIFGVSGISASQFLNAHNAVGLILMVLSTILAGMTYTSSRFEMGVGPDVISKASEMDSAEFFDRVQNQYTDWVKKNQRIHKLNAYAITWVIIFAITGIVFHIGGFTVGFTSARGSAQSFALLGFELLLGVAISLLMTKSDRILGGLIDE